MEYDNKINKAARAYACSIASYLPTSIVKDSNRENKSWSEVLQPYEDAFIAGTNYILNNMQINEEYVTYEQAVNLKDLGFDWKCSAWYNTHGEIWTKCPCAYPAPSLSQAQRWFREKGIILLVHASSSLNDGASYFYNIFKEKSLIDIAATKSYKTYDDALLDGINDAIELLKQLNK